MCWLYGESVLIDIHFVCVCVFWLCGERVLFVWFSLFFLRVELGVLWGYYVANGNRKVRLSRL